MVSDVSGSRCFPAAPIYSLALDHHHTQEFRFLRVPSANYRELSHFRHCRAHRRGETPVRPRKNCAVPSAQRRDCSSFREWRVGLDRAAQELFRLPKSAEPEIGAAECRDHIDSQTMFGGGAGIGLQGQFMFARIHQAMPDDQTIHSGRIVFFAPGANGLSCAGPNGAEHATNSANENRENTARGIAWLDRLFFLSLC